MFTTSAIFKDGFHTACIWSCCWKHSRDKEEDYIVTGSLDSTVICSKWEDENLSLKWKLEGHRLGVTSVDMSNDCRHVASTSLDCQIKIWSVEDGTLHKNIDSGPSESRSVKFSPDSKFLLCSGKPGKLLIYDVSTGELCQEFSLSRPDFVYSACYSPDGRQIAAVYSTGFLLIYDVETGKEIWREAHAKAIRAVAFAPNGKSLVTAGTDKRIRLYESCVDSEVSSLLSGHQSWVLDVSFSDDSLRFASCSADNHVNIWDLTSRHCLWTFYDSNETVGFAYI